MLENWDSTPKNTPLNFKCCIGIGIWRRDRVTGKEIFKMDRATNINAPYYYDIQNIITGMLEVEKRNDAFIFADGTQRPAQLANRINRLKNIIKPYEVEKMEENFLEKETTEQANLVDLDKYTFLERMSARKGVYCFKIREAKR